MTDMLQKKHTRCKAAQPPHDSLIYPNDTSAALSQSVLRRQQQVVLSHVSGSIWPGDPLITVRNGYQGVRGRAFPTGMVLGEIGSIFSYINNPDGTGCSVNLVFPVKNKHYSRSFSLFVFGWEGETTETAMGAIFVHARSRWSPLAAQNIVKMKNRAF